MGPNARLRQPRSRAEEFRRGARERRRPVSARPCRPLPDRIPVLRAGSLARPHSSTDNRSTQMSETTPDQLERIAQCAADIAPVWAATAPRQRATALVAAADALI